MYMAKSDCITTICFKTVCTASCHFATFVRLRAGCRNARLTARLGNRELTVTARLTCGRVARSTVSKP